MKNDKFLTASLPLVLLAISFSIKAENQRIGTGSGGNDKIGEYYYDGLEGEGHRPKLNVKLKDGFCAFENDDIKVVNLNNTTSGYNAYQYVCSEGSDYRNTFIPDRGNSGAYGALNDAYFHGNVTAEMFKQWLGEPISDEQLVIRVHYSINHDGGHLVGFGPWKNKMVNLGDGKINGRFYPLVSLDFVAHEMSHAYTGIHSQLSNFGVQGAVNEAFSDIAGEATEAFFKDNYEKVGLSPDWEFAAEITRVDNAKRYFAHPDDDFKSIGHISNYNSKIETHHAAGLFRKAFYSLANNGSWGIKDAFTAFAKANKRYWRGLKTFNDFACGVKKSASDMNKSTQDIVDAFSVVGIDASCGDKIEPGSFENNSKYDIPDNRASGVFSPIVVPTNHATNQIDVNVNITHTYIGDLKIKLISPNGQQYSLHNRSGRGADDINKTYSVQLEDSLVNGQWQLKVSDHAQRDKGVINKWSISVK